MKIYEIMKAQKNPLVTVMSQLYNPNTLTFTLYIFP